MLTAAGLALTLTPRSKIADQSSKINLEAMVPKQFGDWKLDKLIEPIVFSPDIQANLDRIYSQLLNRVYINGKGEKIMLVITYGNNQSAELQVHRPEVCYPAQGYQVRGMSKSLIDSGGMNLPVMKLVATQGIRVEPITYWIMIGDSPVRGHLEQFLTRLKYGLLGKIPYGILIRVSTISENESQSYRTEEGFVRDMLSAIPAKTRKILTGAD